MIINNNISALNNHRQMGINQAAGQNSMQKLSSGLRINKAGDDAAGLAISEKMRGQIRGLDQASRNAQDGISMIQTAEGALNETHSILQRMRELAVQGANETNTVDDRKEIQKEIEQLKSEIDRISETTEFNTQKLLNGGLGAVGSSSDSTKIGVVSVTGLKTGDYALEITTAASQATLVSNDAYADDTAVATAFGADDKDITINGHQIDTTAVTTKDGLLAAINARKEETGVEASFDGDNKLVLTSTEFGSGQTIAVSGTNGALVAGTFTDGDDAVVNVTNGDVTTEVTGVGKTITYNGAEFEAKGAAADTATVTVSQTGARFQIGANAGQEMMVDVNEMSTKTLGNNQNKVSGVDVTTTDGASQAITTVDDAIKQVSAERSKIGSFQNRLEHTISNLNMSSENLQAAESRIRDVDMAREVMDMTKNNILSQASQAMLAQANQAPQAVLQLLG